VLTELPAKRQEKSISALVMLASGPKFGGQGSPPGIGAPQTAAMPSKFGLLVQSTTIEFPFPIGMDASTCKSGLPSGNNGG
jgi:hypothetical protein